MPRTLPDHRSTLAKQLRHVYNDIDARFPLKDGIARRVGVLVARSWLEYEQVSRESERMAAQRPREKSRRQQHALQLTRSRRRQPSFAGQFLGGLRMLEGLNNGNGHDRPDLLTELMKQDGGAR